MDSRTTRNVAFVGLAAAAIVTGGGNASAFPWFPCPEDDFGPFGAHVYGCGEGPTCDDLMQECDLYCQQAGIGSHRDDGLTYCTSTSDFSCVCIS